MPGSAKSIVITGASSGIGKQLALQLARPGTDLHLIGRCTDRLDDTVRQALELGASATAVPLDLGDLPAAEALLAREFPASRAVDAVYLGAAQTLFGKAEHVLPEDWDILYRVNLLSPIQWTQHFYGNMLRQNGGRIVVVSSLAALAGYPTATPYATMKAGLLGLVRSLAYEGAPHGIRLHLACPGYVETRIYKRAIYRDTSYEATMAQIRRQGFPLIKPEAAAREILRKVAKGRREFAFPGYAAVLAWAAPRMPWMVDLIHKRMLKLYDECR